MNGRSEEALVERILRELEDGRARQKAEIEALMKCLLDCVRELSNQRKPAKQGKSAAAVATMGRAEENARLVLAPHLKGLTEAQRQSFRTGVLDPADVWLGVSCGHFADPAHG